MAGINASASSREIPQNGSQRKQWFLELLEDVTEERVFQDLHNEATLIQKIKDHPDQIEGEVRAEMRTRLLRSPAGYEGFTEGDISSPDKLSRKTILEKFQMLLVGTKSWQDRLKKRVVSLFADETFADTPNGNDHRKMLEKWISKQNEKDIQKYLKSPGLLRRKLGRECFGDERIEKFVSRNTFMGLTELGINSKDLDDTEKAACNAIFHEAISVERQHIQTYLKIIEKSPKDKATKLRLKRDLLRVTLPTVSPRFLVENEVITEAVWKEQVRIGLQNILWDDYFTTWTPEEKIEKQRYFEHVYKKSEHIELPIDDYLENDAFVERIFEAGKQGETIFTEKLEETIIDMRDEKTIAQFDLDGMNIDPDLEWNWHASVVKSIAWLNAGNTSKVKNAQKFEKDSYIRIVRNQNGEKTYVYMKIIGTDTEFSMPVEGKRDKEGLPIKHRGIRFEDWSGGTTDGMLTPWHETIHEIPYAKLWTMLKDPNSTAEILSADEIAKRRKSPEELAAAWEVLSEWEEKIGTVYSEGDAYDSLDTLSDALRWRPTKGAVYTTQEVTGWGDFFIEVMDISEMNKKITISDGKETHAISFSDFYNKIALPLKLKEHGKYATDMDINALIQWIDGFKEIEMKDGVLVQTIKWEDGKNIGLPVNHFMNDDGEWMYFSGISSNGVEAGFGNVKEDKKWKWWDEVKGNLWPFTGNKRNLSIVGMLNFLRENDYKPYVNPKNKPETDHEAHMPHGHGSIWWKIMNNISFSDIGKAFDLYKHAWEHKLEKNSKFQSAKFADKYLRNLMPEGFSYQLRSEAYAAQNEAMDGILKMLENDMSGKEARLYVRKKILLNDDAKFEEVLAGLLYISKKSGQLYPEELSDLKNSNLWFYKLAVTQWYTTKSSRQTLREKCIKSSDKGAEDINAITEIDLVERQLKFYEGKGHRMPPNIAPRFPGAIVEWGDESKKKGDMEVNQRSNIKQMNKYAHSKGYVGEWYKVLGTIDRLHSKNGSPTELNVMPFLMVYSNAPEYMGSNFRKALHSEGTGARASHAFKFGNEISLVNTYRSVVQIAAKEVDRRNMANGRTSSVFDELKKIEDKRKEVGNESPDKDKEDVQKKWITSIYDFWMKYGDKLQPILQMSDTYISAESEFWKDENQKLCRAYKERFTGTSAMQNGQVNKIYENLNVTEGNMTPNHTPFAFTNLMNGAVTAINSHDGQMSRGDVAYEKIFKYWVIGALEYLRNMDDTQVPPWMNKRNIQKMMFREYYAAIMYYLRTKWTKPVSKMLWGEYWWAKIPPANYIWELWRQWITLEEKDFRNSDTTPAWASWNVTTWEHNSLIMDGDDEKRCTEMFETFLNKATSRSVERNTRGRINWGEMWG